MTRPKQATPQITSHEDDRFGELDRAWAEAEAALPEGWAVNLLWGTITEERWAVSAGPFPSVPEHAALHQVAGGPNPAAALRALAVKLREGHP